MRERVGYAFSSLLIAALHSTRDVGKMLEARQTPASAIAGTQRRRELRVVKEEPIWRTHLQRAGAPENLAKYIVAAAGMASSTASWRLAIPSSRDLNFFVTL